MSKMDSQKGKSPYEDRERGTFIVKVDHCENESWQGSVVWAEENKSEHFRSALELIKMIDSAMAKVKAKKNKRDEEGTA